MRDDAPEIICVWAWSLWMRRWSKSRSLTAHLMFGDLAIGLGFAVIELWDEVLAAQRKELEL